MPVTKDQADMLAAIAVACRPHGAPRWDAPGIVAVIGKVKHLSLADVALAVIRAADDRSLETPGAIANTRAGCWRERATDRPAAPEVLKPEDRCGICSERRDRCRRLWANDHEFEPDFKHGTDPEAAARIVEAIKGELQPTAPPPERKTLDDLTPDKRDPRAAEARAALHHEETTMTDHAERAIADGDAA